MRPKKEEQKRTRFVVGGDRINYPGEVATPTADMLAAKLLHGPEYIRVSLKDIPNEIIKEYKSRKIAMENGTVHIEASQQGNVWPATR